MSPGFTTAEGPAFWSRPRLVLCGLLTVLLGLWLGLRDGYQAGGSDSSGYLIYARALREGSLSLPLRPVAGLELEQPDLRAFQPLGTTLRADASALHPTYPSGYPLLIAATSSVMGGRWAPLGTSVLCALACGWLMLLLGRELGLRFHWALAGAVLLCAGPLFLFMAYQAMSDVPATAAACASILCALRARRAAAWGWAAGALLGLAVLIRPTNVLLALPLALAIWDRPKAAAFLALGGMPAGIFFLWSNGQLYGSPFATGYGSVGGLFSASHLPHNLLHMALWVPLLAAPPLACFAPLSWTHSLGGEVRRAVWVLGLWAAALSAFYAFYFHTGETWWYLRFLLPMFPALLLLGLVGLQGWVDRLPRFARSAWALPACGLLASVVLVARLGVYQVPRYERDYLRVCQDLPRHAPEGAVIVCMQVSGSVYYNTGYAVLRYDSLSSQAQERLRSMARRGRPVLAVLFPFETEAGWPQRLGGHWVQVGAKRPVTYWRLQPE